MRALLVLIACLLTCKAGAYRKVLAMPAGNVPVSICDHRLGATATFSECTDGLLSPTVYSAELYALRNNIQITAFINNANLPWSAVELRGMDSTGRWSFGIYYPTDRWLNPVTNMVGQIPDYYNDEWTAAGVAVFSNVVLGDPKPDRYPNHGQQMYDVSGGEYGYDVTNDVMGGSELAESNGLAESMVSYYETVLGRKPTALSYRNGRNEGAAFLVPYFLSGRNSDASYSGDSRTLYGYNLGLPAATNVTRMGMINTPPSTRWYDMGHNLPADNYSRQEITKTIANHGWLNNFIHYHSATLDYVNRYFRLVDSTIDTHFVWRAGYGEAMEYMWQREVVRKVIALETDDTVRVFVALDGEKCEDTITGVDTRMLFDRIKTPVSLVIDLAGTALEGQHVKSRKGKLLPLGDDKYILDWQLSSEGAKEMIFTNIITATDTPRYIDLDRPQITSSTVGASTITVTTDVPTKAVLFRAAVGAPDYQVTKYSRKNTLSTSHVFDISGTYDWYVGVITEYNQSKLQKLTP